ncbi:MAG: CHAT domain-containing protein [Planctomycetota bacterium]
MARFLLTVSPDGAELTLWSVSADSPQDASRQRMGNRPLTEDLMAELTACTPSDWTKLGVAELLGMGRRLAGWLNGPELWCEQLEHGTGPIVLFIEGPAAAGSPADVSSVSDSRRMDRQQALWSAPWELLADPSGFWAQRTDRLFCPVRWLPLPREPRPAANRPLRLLFMAASPQNVEPVLSFEREEGIILNAVRGGETELVVEESGSLDGLRWRMERARDFDVVHLTAHAEGASGLPMILLEDEVGDLFRATQADLTETLAQRWPRLVFLSGCETGLERVGERVPSLSEGVLRGGASAVLGWALPVNDFQASEASASLYHWLGNGDDLAVSIASARREILRLELELAAMGWRRSNWHLMRLYVAGAFPGESVVTRPGTDGRELPHVRDAVTEFLDARSSGRPICKRENFVGRRRLLQAALRTLRAVPGDAGFSSGIVLHGLGGNGKSSLAARIADRFDGWSRVVVFGVLDEDKLLTALDDVLLDAEANQTLFSRQQHLAQRLMKVLEHPPGNRRLLFVLDDFEQNMDSPGVVRLETLDVLRPLLKAVHRCAGHCRVMITTRHDFERASEDRLLRLPVSAMLDEDLSKKLQQLTALQSPLVDKALRDRALRLGGGNPLLLEKLDGLLRCDATDVTPVLERLEAAAEEFRGELLLRELVALLSEPTQAAIRQLAVHELPFDADVADETVGVTPASGAKSWDRAAAVRLGVLETVSSPTDKVTLFQVAELAREVLFAELDAEQQTAVIDRAAIARFARWPRERRAKDESLGREALRLALAARQPDAAATVAHDLSIQLYNTHREGQLAELCEPVLALGRDWRLLRWIAVTRLLAGDGPAVETLLAEAEVASAHVTAADSDAFGDRIALLLERGRYLARAGRLESAADRFHLAQVGARELGDERMIAISAGNLADILQARGELDEALHIRREEELPVYERVGDVRQRAVTMGKIADILRLRGELDEAFRIRREEQLPVYERLGDMRAWAVTMGKIADILQDRGELDEALRIRREEQLPAFERLGDVRARAVTMGKIADILQTRGELDEALRIRREEELPVFERLGDVRERAVTMGKVADILQARGELDESLRIRREEELPVYERLGDVRARAMTMGKIARIEMAKGNVDEVLRLRRTEVLPAFIKLGDPRLVAVEMGNIANILQARGELDEALRLRREEQLPIFERLGDVRQLIFGRTNLALLLVERGRHKEDAKEIVSLLTWSLREARRLRLPVAGQIEAILRQLSGG